MKKQNINNKKGFTIIEVVLVLAIAGLIFLMVFVALPALQRSQRDTQRRDDMARFMSQLSQYEANNSGRTPAQNASNVTEANTANWLNNFVSPYLRSNGESFTDPDGTDYRVGYVCVLTSASQCNPSSTAAAATGYTAATAIAPNANNMEWNRDKHNIYVYVGARCNGESITYVPNSPRLIAIRYKLEGAGIYCNNN